jgi:hypothetical protein
MRKKNGLIAVIVLLVIGLTVVIAWLGLRNQYSWIEDYKESNKGPYGTYVLQQLLKSYAGEKQPLIVIEKKFKELPVKTKRPSNYVFVGEALYFDTNDVKRLLKFVKNGNTAFIASKTLPFEMMDKLYSDPCDTIQWNEYKTEEDSLVHMNLRHPKLHSNKDFPFYYQYRAKRISVNWHFIDSSYFCGDPKGLTPLGTFNKGKINFARMPYGRGFFYFHTNPVVFSNLHLIHKRSLDYANRVFSHLVVGPIYWDKYSRIPENLGRRRNNSPYDDRRKMAKSPLKYILSQPPLAWAWYLLLAMGLIYLVFRTKRRQRIVPVIGQNTNTSLEFLRTIGRLYFFQNNHRSLALQKMKQFLFFLRDRYGLNIRELNQEWINEIAKKAEVDPKHITYIARQYQNIGDAATINDKTLIDFHHSIETFYKQCK